MEYDKINQQVISVKILYWRIKYKCYSILIYKSTLLILWKQIANTKQHPCVLVFQSSFNCAVTLSIAAFGPTKMKIFNLYAKNILHKK